jgi:hypothetical protein
MPRVALCGLNLAPGMTLLAYSAARGVGSWARRRP